MSVLARSLEPMFDNSAYTVHRILHIFVFPDANDPPPCFCKGRVCDAVPFDVPP